MKKLLILAAICGYLSSCSKQGCTDKLADNYDASAKRNTGCTYTGSALIWYGKNTAEQLGKDGATSLRYYVAGELIGSSGASVYWTGAPDCGQQGAITITKSLGPTTNKVYDYRVVDQNDHEYWKGTLNFTAGSCERLELTW